MRTGMRTGMRRCVQSGGDNRVPPVPDTWQVLAVQDHLYTVAIRGVSQGQRVDIQKMGHYKE